MDVKVWLRHLAIWLPGMTVISWAVFGLQPDGWSFQAGWNGMLTLLGGLWSFGGIVVVATLTGVLILAIKYLADTRFSSKNGLKKLGVYGVIIVLFALALFVGVRWVSLPDGRSWFLLVMLIIAGIGSFSTYYFGGGSTDEGGDLWDAEDTFGYADRSPQEPKEPTSGHSARATAADDRPTAHLPAAPARRETWTDDDERANHQVTRRPVRDDPPAQGRTVTGVSPADMQVPVVPVRPEGRTVTGVSPSDV